jgi:hypothetical protein
MQLLQLLIKNCEVGLQHEGGGRFRMFAKGPIGVAALIVLALILRHGF